MAVSGLLSVLVLGAAALFSNGLAPLSDVTAPPAIGTLSATDCGTCHARIYEQWASSRHRHSFTNSVFRASYHRSPEPWCVYCHAPLPEQAAAILGTQRPSIETSLVGEGVNCAVCHVRGGEILSVRAPTLAGTAAHPMRHEPLLASAEFCGGCHQFNWPHDDAPLRYTTEPMQDTLSEWRNSISARSGKNCQQCHMPTGSHNFLGGHDAALVRRTVNARVARLPSGQIRVTLRATAAGHRVPTGDPFRRLCVELCQEPVCTQPTQRILFWRVFAKSGDRFVLDYDLAIPPPQNEQPAQQSITVRGLPASVRFYRVLYQFAAPGTESLLRRQDRQVELVHGAILENQRAEGAPATPSSSSSSPSDKGM